MTLPDGTEVLTGREVCEVLRVHPNTLASVIAAGLPHFRIGGRIRVLRSDLDAWVASRRKFGPARTVDAWRCAIGDW